jgi:tRNA(Arg) A34 adenosine deaminase TadA
MLVALVAVASLALVSDARGEPLTLPLPLSTEVSLLEQFGYAPTYQRNVVAFDAGNRPVIRSRTASQNDTQYAAFFENGGWRESVLDHALRAAYPTFAGYMGAGGYASDRVVVDTVGRAYTIVTIRLEEGEFRNVLMYSTDRGQSWGVTELPFGAAQPHRDDANRGNVACEMPTGQRVIAGPPFIAVWREIGDWPGGFASLNELYVLQPYWEGDTLVVPPPVLVTARFLGMLQSVGDTSFATTVGTKTYFTWTQVRDTPTVGTPTYVGVYDHVTGTVVKRIRAAFGHPVNDSHCTPALALDSKGFLHLIAGAHGRPFRYTRSVRPLDISEWTPAVKVLDSGYWTPETDSDGIGKQTYASLVCGPDDTLHLVFRQTRLSRTGLFPLRSYHALSYQQKAPGGSWSKARMLAYPARGGGYTNYYQKLSADRDGRLYLSFNVFRHDSPSLYWVLRRFRHRIVWWSPDGRDWQFATTESMAQHAAPLTIDEGLTDVDDHVDAPPESAEAIALTDWEKQRAVEAAIADEHLLRMLPETGWWIEDVAPWTAGLPAETLGAVVLIYLEEPVVVNDDWPLLEIGASETEAGTVSADIQASGVTAVKVLVEFPEDRVRHMEPLVYESALRDGIDMRDRATDQSTGHVDETAMARAVEAAQRGVAAGEQPHGAAVIDPAGVVIASAHDEVRTRRDPTAHAGLLAVQEAVRAYGPDLTGCTLVSTMEPCAMCFQAAWWTGISRVSYGLSMLEVLTIAPDAFEEIVIDAPTLNARSSRRLVLTPGVLRAECRALWGGR